MDMQGDFLGPPHGTTTRTLIIKVKSMQRSGTEAIRTQIQPIKPKQRRHSGLVVEHRTREQEVGGLILTQVAVLYP